MAESYRKPDSQVKRSRSTITFEPYYWEAYNEIVHPQRLRWYLDTKWLPDLKPLGHAIVCFLRSSLYFNPSRDEVRNSIEIDMTQMARHVGVSRATLFREFKDNAALAQFVRREPTYQQVSDTRVHQAANTYWVAMDDPIHPDDMERYEALRAAKEWDRQSTARVRVKPRPAHESQNETHGETGPALESQIETQGSQNEITQSQNETASSNVSSLPLNTSITAALAPPHKCGPPEGEGEESGDTWSACLTLLRTRVNKPTFETHMRGLRLISVNEGTVQLAVPSPFTRDWLEKRHGSLIEEVLAQVLQRPIEVRFVVQKDAVK